MAKTHLSSLPLQMALYFNGWYLPLFYPVEIGLVLYKALILPYPARNLASEVILLLFMVLLDVIRIFFGCKGNLTERKLSLILSLVFVVPLFFAYLYFTLWQTYVLRVELIFLSIAFLGLLLEVFFGIITLWIFQRNDISR